MLTSAKRARAISNKNKRILSIFHMYIWIKYMRHGESIFLNNTYGKNKLLQYQPTKNNDYYTFTLKRNIAYFPKR